MLHIVAGVFLITTAIAQEESAYYGFPVGEITHEQSSTSGMLFLADPQTIIITNFTHLPNDDIGCYSIILGPAPTQGFAMKEEKMTKDGILLRYSPINILRKKRSAEVAVSAENSAGHMNREKRQQARGRVSTAPADRVQMDSLIERAADEKAAGSGESSAREQEKEVTQQASLVAFAVDMGRREKNKRSSKRKEIMGDIHSLEMLHDIESAEDLDSSEDDIRTALEEANDERLIVDKLNVDSNSLEESFEEEDRKQMHERVEIENREKDEEKALSQMEEMMLVEAIDMINSTMKSTANSTIDEGDHEKDETTIVKEQSKRAVKNHDIEGSGVESSHTTKMSGRHDRHMSGDHTTHSEKEMTRRQSEKSGNRTHTASARQAGGENDLTDATTKNSIESSESPFVPNEFSLPKLKGGRASFSLREHGKLADFSWIGIYDQCMKKAYQLHEIAGSEIPDLEAVSPLTGVAANVSSDSVQIVNCNTIVIQNFQFYKDEKRPITRKHYSDDILETVNGSDLVVKLPDGVRTFDVDFLMVFNEDTNRSYGHTFIPSLLVPPCDNL